MSNKHHRKHTSKVLVADQGSACFDDLRWKGGTAFATFAKDGSQYTYDMSRGDFEEWMDSGSLGGWFNEELK
jgi:hypothetical protein